MVVLYQEIKEYGIFGVRLFSRNVSNVFYGYRCCLLSTERLHSVLEIGATKRLADTLVYCTFQRNVLYLKLFCTGTVDLSYFVKVES